MKNIIKAAVVVAILTAGTAHAVSPEQQARFEAGQAAYNAELNAWKAEGAKRAEAAREAYRQQVEAERKQEELAQREQALAQREAQLRQAQIEQSIARGTQGFLQNFQQRNDLSRRAQATQTVCYTIGNTLYCDTK